MNHLRNFVSTDGETHVVQKVHIQTICIYTANRFMKFVSTVRSKYKEYRTQVHSKTIFSFLFTLLGINVYLLRK